MKRVCPGHSFMSSLLLARPVSAHQRCSEGSPHACLCVRRWGNERDELMICSKRPAGERCCGLGLRVPEVDGSGGESKAWSGGTCPCRQGCRWSRDQKAKQKWIQLNERSSPRLQVVNTVRPGLTAERLGV